MGWDAFGLPAEEHARKTGEHPRINTENNINNFRRQLKRPCFAYDWDREVNTTDPGHVRWTQWIFLQLYHSYFDETSGKAKPIAELEKAGLSRDEIDAKRLAYVAEAPVNWCPELGTVLANEEVEEWRSKGHTVERRPLKQWMLRITAYAQRLIDGLDGLDWPEGIKLLQKNWIGRSEGAEVDFRIGGGSVTVFTTRPDTLFGATYMVFAPEHPLVDKIVTSDRKEAVEAYRKACAAKSDLERNELAKEKSGVFTGGTATNPVNEPLLPRPKGGKDAEGMKKQIPSNWRWVNGERRVPAAWRHPEDGTGCAAAPAAAGRRRSFRKGSVTTTTPSKRSSSCIRQLRFCLIEPAHDSSRLTHFEFGILAWSRSCGGADYGGQGRAGFGQS